MTEWSNVYCPPAPNTPAKRSLMSYARGEWCPRRKNDEAFTHETHRHTIIVLNLDTEAKARKLAKLLAYMTGQTIVLRDSERP